jgi:rhodanese-related sulfurtransferase
MTAHLVELPRDKEIHVICRSGQRAFTATRCLMQNGFDASVRSGEMLSRVVWTTS